MFRHLITIIFYFVLTSSVLAAPALTTPVATKPEIKLTQRDLMLGLVDGLGWSFGLPEQAKDVDYLQILSGERKFRIEIEDNYDSKTRVIIEEIFSFGNYSGQGWVRVPNRPTELQVFFNVPISGDYRVKVRLLENGHIIQFGETTFNADGSDRLTDTDLGTVYLQAGMQEINMIAPARGGIDFIEIEALPMPAVEPTGGWKLDAPLTFDDLAVTAMQILNLHSTLPRIGEDLILQAEDYPLPKRSKLSTRRHLGSPNQGKWVSIGSDPVTLEIGVNVPEQGVYDLSVNCVGKEEISGTVNSQPFHVSPERKFTEKQAGGVTLKQGETPLSFNLPPYCGLDQVVLTPLASTPEDFRHLTGLPQVGTPSPEQFNSFIKMLAAFGIVR